jgi:hypothetical protein
VQLLPYLQGINPAILNPMIMRGIVNPGGNCMKGVQFVVDEHGNKTAVVINLKHYSELWEDFYDRSSCQLLLTFSQRVVVS